jgi:putative Holliday junction resolvase
VTILGIDYGDRRLGLARSDSTGLIAGGLPTLERSDPAAEVVEPLRRLCQEHGVERIVVGVPINMDGSRGPRAQVSLDFAAKLRVALGIEVMTWDERLTTVQAERAMLQADLSRAKRRERRDRVAAVLLLQNYLDALRRKPGG